MGALSASHIVKTPLICVLFKKGEDRALRETLESLRASETQGEIVVASEKDVFDSQGPQLNYRHVWMTPGRGSLICRAWGKLRSENRDILFLRAGVRVARNWDILLCSTACLDPTIAAVSPLSARDPFFSLASHPNHGHWDPHAVNAWLQSLGRHKVFDVPVFLGSCVFLRHSALESLEQDFCNLNDDSLAQALSAKGWSLVGCENVYVDDAKAAGQQHDTMLETREDVLDFLHHHPLTGLRWAFEHQLEEEKTVEIDTIRPVQLHVAHSWGGGLGQWVNDFIMADKTRRNLVLRSIGSWGSFGQRLALYNGAGPVPIEEWNLSLPIRATAPSHYEYKQVLEEIIHKYGVEVIVVSSVIGHSLDILRTALKTIVIFHDYYPICPFLYLSFHGTCRECSEKIMRFCFAENRLPRIFRNVTLSEWFSLRETFVGALTFNNISLVAPSPSVFRNLFEVESRLAALEHHIVPHGLPDLFTKRAAKPSRKGSFTERKAGLHVLVPGRVSQEKGQSLLLKVIGRLCHSYQFTLLGCGEDGQAFKHFPHVTLIPNYERNHLPAIIDDLKPDLALLASIVPETFSYALSELWALGVPVLATKVGSFLDRVEHGVNGWLCEPNAEEIVQKLRSLETSFNLIEEVAQRLQSYRPRSCSEMVMDYHRLTPLPFCDQRRLKAFLPKVMDPSALTSAPNRALHIDPQAPFRVVLLEFLDYAISKMQRSPRLHPVFRKPLAALLRFFQSLLTPRGRRFRRPL
ncbi:MAG: glycosyltransferase family 4 protein [Desulfosoma sp.]